MGRRETAVLDVCERLRAAAGEQARSGTVFFPPVDALVPMCGASRTTVIKALHRLAAEGLLDIRPGKGVILGPALRHPSPSPVPALPAVMPVTPALAPKNRFEQLLVVLRRDILSSHYGHAGALPPAKVLRGRYGAGRSALRRALLQLTAENYLIPDKKHFRVARPAGRTAKSSLVVIAHSNVTHFPLDLTPRSGRFWSYLEDERQRLDVSLTVIDSLEATGRGHDDTSRYRDVRDLHAHETVLGFVVLRAAMAAEVFDELAAILAALKRPTVIIDESGEVSSRDMDLVTGRYPTIRYFGVATSERAGHDMGRFLLRTGHRRVAYYPALEQSLWARNRFSGLRRAFEEAGLADGAVDLPAGAEMRVSDLDGALKGVPQVAALRAAFHSFAPGLNPWSKEGYYIRLNEAHIDRHIRSHFVLNRTHRSLMTMIREVKPTACVGCNDLAALIAMGFLKAHRKAAGAAMSVVGFDNSPEALGNRLTTYDFNIKGIINAALAFIVDGRDLVDPSVHEIPGFVVERATHRVLGM